MKNSSKYLLAGLAAAGLAGALYYFSTKAPTATKTPSPVVASPIATNPVVITPNPNVVTPSPAVVKAPNSVIINDPLPTITQTPGYTTVVYGSYNSGGVVNPAVVMVPDVAGLSPKVLTSPSALNMYGSSNTGPLSV